MRIKFLNFLRCIHCKNALECTPFEEDRMEDEHAVTDGLLRCSCGQIYPVIHGVPRLLPASQWHLLYAAYESYFSAYKRYFNAEGSKTIHTSHEGKTSLNLKHQTIRNFGYEWRTFHDYDLKNFESLLSPLSASEFKNRRVLDAGCGAGRHAKASADFGAQMVFGIDISYAVDAAYLNTKQYPQICIVQGDLYHVPFMEKSFDIIYSIGVLHHLPEPVRGFKSLAPLLDAGGTLTFWVYSSQRKTSRRMIEAFRKITKHLPHPLLKAVSFLCAVLDFFFFIKPYQLLSKNKALESFLKARVPSRIVDYARYDFYVTYVDWIDRLVAPVSHYHSGEELSQWFSDAGFSNFQVTPTEDWGWKGAATRNG